MSDLREHLAESGFKDVRTLLQSGNIVLQSESAKRGEVERRIEAVVASAFGRPTECFARTAVEWRAIIARNPFPREAAEDPARTTALLLKETPPTRAWRALQAAISGPEIVRGASDHGYIVFPEGQGRSRLTPDRIERALGTRATIRNWNTVTKIGDLLSP